MIRTALFSWRSPGDAIPWSHVCLWLGAVRYARRIFDDVVLVADAPGREMLVSALALPFTTVLPLPEIPSDLGHVYELPKLHAHRLLSGMGIPALHVDFDAMLRRPLPGKLLAAPACAEFLYPPHSFVGEILARMPAPRLRAPCDGAAGGIMGGTDCAAIEAWASASIACATDPKNRAVLLAENGYQASVILGEIAFASHFAGRIEVLLPRGTACRADYQRAGYVHLAGLKQDRGALAQAEMMISRDFPEAYEKTARLWDAL